MMGGPPLTGILGAGLAALAAAVLAWCAWRRRGGARHARVLLAAGSAASALVPPLAPMVDSAARHGWLAAPPPVTVTATTAVTVTALAALLLVAGLIGLGGVHSYLGALLRHALDAAVVTGALCFIGWAVAVQSYPGTVARVVLACPLAAVSGAVLVACLGVAATAMRRARPPRVGVLAAGSGALLIMVGGTAIGLGLCRHLPLAVDIGAAAVGVGALALAAATFAADSPGPDPAAVLRSGTVLVLPPVVAAVTAGVYHGLTVGWIDPFGGTAAAVVGFGLAVRHHLTVVDARRYAERLSQREAHFRQLANTDPLTGLANRRGLLEALPSRVAAGQPCVLLALDLDGFKDVNDLRGHDVGDAVLVEVGRRIAAHTRRGDFAARLGGDEFAIFTPTAPKHARPLAERMLVELSAPYQVAGATAFLSVSIGLADGAAAADVPTLLRNADVALRYAKQQGKARIEEYDAAYDAGARRRSTLRLALRGAIERGELHVVYQPVMALPSTRPVGAEALLRWHHPELGPVSAAEFMPVAEETGQISELTSWLLHQACQLLSHVLAEGHDAWVSVNVSPRQLRCGDYLRQLREALETYQVPSWRLVVEVTEHAVATDADGLADRLARLRSTGVRIALDDVGAGYSSLGQLRELPIDVLKSDHRLLDPGAGGGRRATPLVDVVVRLGQRLGLEVIAGGVSDAESLRAAIDAGCRYGQGPLLGAAVPAEHVEAAFGGGRGDRGGAGYVSARSGAVLRASAAAGDPAGVPQVGKT